MSTNGGHCNRIDNSSTTSTIKLILDLQVPPSDALSRHCDWCGDVAMSADNIGISVFEGLLSQVSAYIARRIPFKLRSRIGVDDVLQEIARTILRTTLQSPFSLSQQDWERMIWVVVRRQLRKQLRIVSSPEDESSVQLKEFEFSAYSMAKRDDIDACDALDELCEILNKCSDRQRRIVCFRLEGLNNTEIAACEGVNEGSVRRQLAKVEELFLSSRS
jgi:RNA polymerase sigma factor (sigma-70 family)